MDRLTLLNYIKDLIHAGLNKASSKLYFESKMGIDYFIDHNREHIRPIIKHLNKDFGTDVQGELRRAVVDFLQAEGITIV